MKYSNKIFSDGANFIANEAYASVRISQQPKREKTEMDYFFDDVYKVACLKFSVTPEKMKEYILDCMTKMFGECEGLSEYVEKKMKAKAKALYQRKMRFWRKAYLNQFNYFYTQTYDSAKYDSEEEFRDDLKKVLSNMHSRRGWRYAGVWEEGGKNGRLHIHMLLYVPGNQMPGICKLKRDYSLKKHKMEVRNENSFFAARFGRNDFTPLNMQGRFKKPIQYIAKYLEKTFEEVLYSRGLPTYLETVITDNEIAAEIEAHKKIDDENGIVVFLRYVTFPFIEYHPVFRWYRSDGVKILPRSG